MTAETLYEIDSAYRQLLIDANFAAEENDGVIPDDLSAKIDALEITRDAKIENTVKWYKNSAAMAEMLNREAEALKKRAKGYENQQQYAKTMLANTVQPGEKPEYGCGKISWRKSSQTVVLDVAQLPQECLKVKTEIALSVVKELVESGKLPKEIAVVETKNNIQIK